MFAPGELSSPSPGVSQDPDLMPSRPGTALPRGNQGNTTFARQSSDPISRTTTIAITSTANCRRLVRLRPTRPSTWPSPAVSFFTSVRHRFHPTESSYTDWISSLRRRFRQEVPLNRYITPTPRWNTSDGVMSLLTPRHEGSCIIIVHAKARIERENKDAMWF